MVFNRPRNFSTLQALRSQVNLVEDQRKPIYISVGNMSHAGQATAADKRGSNNSLITAFNPVGLLEGKMMYQGMRESKEANEIEAVMRASLAAPTKMLHDATVNNNKEDETPVVVVRTRQDILAKRATDCGNMSNEERKRSLKALKALT